MFLWTEKSQKLIGQVFLAEGIFTKQRNKAPLPIHPKQSKFGLGALSPEQFLQLITQHFPRLFLQLTLDDFDQQFVQFQRIGDQVVWSAQAQRYGNAFKLRQF